MTDNMRNGRDEPAFLTETDLAQRWSVSAATLRNWRSAGTGPVFTKLGRSVRYSAEAVREFERTNMQAWKDGQ